MRIDKTQNGWAIASLVILGVSAAAYVAAAAQAVGNQRVDCDVAQAQRPGRPEDRDADEAALRAPPDPDGESSFHAPSVVAVHPMSGDASGTAL